VDPSAQRSLGRSLAALLVALLIASSIQIASGPPTASAQTVSGCFAPDVPSWFHRRVARAIKISRDLPRAWVRSPYIARIVCWQGTGFKTSFRARGRGYHIYRGMFAMTTQEVQTIAGPWMTANRFGLRLTPRCFARGWDACTNVAANADFIQQIIAGLRWIWLQYGNPTAAWSHIRRTGRFNAYPRSGTSNAPTRAPFRRCPVGGGVFYRDGFGERRTVGGYHPHWGIDMIAPAGRPIRAPFDGFAVAHRDGWFAGLWVTIVGEHGYVRNVHLRRFARLGYVRAGTIVGYVGATGDARGPHDHFEWHPWAVPSPRHRAPSGFSLVMDAIDPYPFLNEACGAHRVAKAAVSAGSPARPIGE
jgi:murein DD-endopeptidase MepM/ murein hydrolase activator NlpD